MQRIVEKNINTPQEYNRIFHLNETKAWCDFDIERWKLMLKYFRGGKLMDLGCFDSPLGDMAKRKCGYSEVWGLDYADEAIKYAKEQYKNVNYLVGDVYNIPFNDETFNYVTAGELIEHLEDIKGFIKEAVRILKPGGIFSLSCPMEETGIGEVDKDRHLWKISKQDVFDLLKPHGLVHTFIIGSQQNPYKYHFPVLLAYCQKHSKIDNG